MKRSVLVVDDDPSVCAGLSALLEDMGWEVCQAENAREAYVQFSSCSPDVVVLDVQLPDASGIDVLRQFKDYSESTAVIMMSGVGTIDRVIDCMKAGAETFIAKPFDSDTLTVALEQVARSLASRQHLAALTRESVNGVERFPGHSPAADALNKLIDQVAPASSPLLLEGESGTGKGVLARLIHKRSPRSRAPFVDLNCAGLSKELLESELFGHEKGAFTGAVSTKQGLFEIAAGGTLVLDEIGEMDMSIQARLLKALEDRKFRRVGGVRDLQADFRLIAATNRTLRDEVAEGRFRKDLYYRLNVITIRVPPLRERLEDVPTLAQQLLGRLSADLGRKGLRISDRAMKKLMDYPWPGNVRELRNVLERALLVASGNEIRVEDLYLEAGVRDLGETTAHPLREWEVKPLEQITVEYVRSAVEAVGGNMRKAARLLEISPSTLYAKMRERETESAAK